MSYDYTTVDGIYCIESICLNGAKCDKCNNLAVVCGRFRKLPYGRYFVYKDCAAHCTTSGLKGKFGIELMNFVPS